ncbi:MAG TPA: GerMN domain-containing protein [Thermoanaerobaculia bacterium]|nr:GerMN domain-containing protein [Thermoanaerobaculia bacterium]
MPRRFALGLVALLVLLLVGLFAGRRILMPSAPGSGGIAPTPTARPTPIAPPTPIASQRVSLWFEPAEGELFRAEVRELPAAADEIAFLRALGAAVLDGPRREELLRPFPEGWSLRGAYRLRDGLVVLDLQPPAPGGVGAMEGPPAPEASLGPRWQTGSHEELAAVQALLITIAKNLPDVSKVALVVSGEPAETLAGHVDLMHPLVPDLSRAATEPPLEAAAPPSPAALPTPAETETPAGATPTSPPLPPPPKRTRPAARTDVA